MEQVFKPNRGGLDELNRGGESLQDVLLPEAKMLESTTVIHGTQKEVTVKITDKSKRAYDISMESTRALELAIQKDNR